MEDYVISPARFLMDNANFWAMQPGFQIDFFDTHVYMTKTSDGENNKNMKELNEGPLKT